MILRTTTICIQGMPLTAAMSPATNSRHQLCRSESVFTRRESGSRPQSLGEMFKAPKGIMFEGNFEAAKEEALKRSMWLV